LFDFIFKGFSLLFRYQQQYLKKIGSLHIRKYFTKFSKKENKNLKQVIDIIANQKTQ
jgi:hypothetical protein